MVIILTKDKESEVWFSITPVTQMQWAHFIRSGEFFRDEYWGQTPGQNRTNRKGGDEILRRTFNWQARNLALENVSWYEAVAFTRGVGGRLPWYDELKRWMATPQRVFGIRLHNRHVNNCKTIVGRYRAFYSEANARWSKAGALIEENVGEWCENDFNSFSTARGARPEPPERKVVLNHSETAISPTSDSKKIGFRVVVESLKLQDCQVSVERITDAKSQFAILKYRSPR